MRIAFIGFGNMAAAIARGIIGSPPEGLEAICAYDKYKTDAGELAEKVMLSGSPLQAVSGAKYVFICVKPQSLEEALDELREALAPDMTLISIVAGARAERISELTGGVCPVIRVMPNTPLLIGEGATAIARQDNVSEEDYAFIYGVFSSIGCVCEIPKDRFNEIIPVNSSSPAFFYKLVKLLADFGEEYGIDRESGIKLAASAMKGSADMILTSGRDVDELISMVCSKGGTTLSALDAMSKSGFENSVKCGFDACIKRAYELG